LIESVKPLSEGLAFSMSVVLTIQYLQ